MTGSCANLEQRMWFGCGYYPEWVDRSQWSEDARQMNELGLNCVRLGDFCWSRLEPREGEYTLDWLEEAIGVLGDYDIQTMLTLPTAGPPRWVSLKYPETLPVRRDGRRMPFGSRNHLCINAPAGQRLNLRLLDVLLERFAANPHIFSWALGNEIGKHYSCFCRPQIDRIHEKAPGMPVTVNFRLAPDEHDSFKLAQALDVVGANYYPGPTTGFWPVLKTCAAGPLRRGF
jgi:beta-galactosidase GanA